jgi:hypothetical protein
VNLLHQLRTLSIAAKKDGSPFTDEAVFADRATLIKEIL